MNRRNVIALAATTVAAPLVARAQDAWPNRPVTLLVPFAAGGSNDVVARLLAPALEAKFGQPFVVENRPGGGGSLGMGMVARDNAGRWWLTPERGAALTVGDQPLKSRIALHSDHDPEPTVIGFDEGKGLLTLLRRGDRDALRIRHADAPTRLQFAGLQYWPADPSWRIEARFLPHPPGRTLPIGDIVGTQSDSPNPGVVEFERDGRSFRLEALGEPGRELFFVLADRTSGHGSYPAGRFLDAQWPGADGKVVLDFNRAYNPPCAFTLYATCPLPPPENRLDLAIEAGEKTYVSPVR